MRTTRVLIVLSIFGAFTLHASQKTPQVSPRLLDEKSVEVKQPRRSSSSQLAALTALTGALTIETKEPETKDIACMHGFKSASVCPFDNCRITSLRKSRSPHGKPVKPT